MNREVGQKIFTRLMPALLAGALAAVAVWGAGLLWAAPLARLAWPLAAICWGLVFLAPVAWRDAVGTLIAHLTAALVCGAIFLAGKIAWPPAMPFGCWFGLFAVALLAIRWRITRTEVEAGAESARLLLLGLAAWWGCRPFFTANLLGGLDARWYAYTLFDFLEQWRNGVFPVLIGQGSYQFNGAVHPFRFAPYFHYLAGALDWISLRTLGGFALQHLTVIASTFGGAGTMYFSLASLAPRRRWTAAVVAVCYVLCPAWLGLVSFLDMYMSYMAVVWLPVIFWGVARWFERRDLVAMMLVAVGLSVTWTCHAPVALWASLVAFGVLGADEIARGVSWRGAARLAGTVGLFAALSAYHFYSILEVTPPAANAPRAGFAVAWLWLFGSGLVLGLAAWKLFPGSEDAQNSEAQRANRLLAAGGGILLLAGLGGGWLVATKDPVIAETVAYAKIFWPAVLRPVHLPGALFSDVQPGYALWMLAVLAMLAAVWAREARAKLLGLAWLGLTCFLLPFSHATEALWSLLPTSVLVATSGAVNLRLSPVWVTVMAFAGFGALAWLATARPRWHALFVGLLVALLPWTWREAGKLDSRLAALEFSPAASENFRRPENAPLFIYSGNQIGSPGYFSHGVRDYRLESRVLDPRTFAVRPELAIAAPPPPGREIVFSIKPAGGAWELAPHLTLLRDEPWVTYWKFSGAVPAGILMLNSTDISREYPLPSSGGPKSFGAGPTNSRELPLWTMSPYPEELTLRILPNEPVDATAAAREFARVELHPLRDDWLPVKTLALIPAYRALVEAREPALLETCRTWAPGYRATRNGRTVAPVRTPEGLVGVPLEPGVNEVTVGFAGTPWLWRMFFVSLTAWVAAGVWLLRHVRGKHFVQHFLGVGV